MGQVPRARSLVFHEMRFTRNGIRFWYRIDGVPYSYFSALNDPRPTLSDEHRYLVAAQIGLSYLIDLAILVLPETVVIEPIHLPARGLAFWNDVYQQLAMERLYTEQLRLGVLKSRWTAPSSVRLRPMSHPAAAGTLLAMSGGKESLTALKLLENTPGLGLFFLQYDDPIWHHMARCQDRLQEDHPTLRVSFRRYKSIELINRYQSSDYFSLVIGQIVFNAMLYADRYRYLVIGNEYSANFGNAVYHGRAVNHQYDKGLAFARRVNAYIRQFVSRDFRYFSPFFGLYEYRIAQLFFADNRFLDIWTSCNNSNRAANFCCQCVKCAFTYVIALPWTTPKVLRRVFGRDLLDDLDLFRQLMDFDAAKPFDCVGGKEEVWLALHQARLQNKERNSPALRYFRTAILPGIEHRLPGIRKELEGEHTGLRYVPPEFRALLIRRLRSIGCRPTNATPPSGA